MTGVDDGVFALAGRLGCAWVTAAYTPADHAVTNDVHAAALETGAATFIGVCGAIFTPAAMITPPKPGCPICVAWLRAREHEHQPQPRYDQHPPVARHRRRRRVVGRLWCRLVRWVIRARVDVIPVPRAGSSGLAVGIGRDVSPVSTARHHVGSDTR